MFLVFFILWSLLIYAVVLKILLDDLIFYIQSSWIPKNLPEDNCSRMYLWHWKC